MNVEKAKDFIRENARDVEKAEFCCLLEGGPRGAFIDAMKAYQNPDGGFGGGLEPDFWNPASSPIATNDAMMRLFYAGALEDAGELTEGMVRFLTSGKEFDAARQRWLFAIESNRDYPHAIWWEKKPDDVPGWNPTVSLAAFLVCMGEKEPWRGLVKEAFAELAQKGEKSGDGVKCFMLAWRLLKHYGIEDVVDLQKERETIVGALRGAICPDTEKYGVEYVPTPSWFFQGESPFLYDGAAPLIKAELAAIGKQQMEDGGFDITWQWHTPYEDEFQTARRWWRPRVTREKLMFYLQHKG